jgi:hypothetical protein
MGLIILLLAIFAIYVVGSVVWTVLSLAWLILRPTPTTVLPADPQPEFFDNWSNRKRNVVGLAGIGMIVAVIVLPFIAIATH